MSNYTSTASHDFLVQVSAFFKEVRSDYREVVYPRRLFVNADKNRPVPLRAWVDDPTWTPAGAGMLPVSPEARRSQPDVPFWTMPQSK